MPDTFKVGETFGGFKVLSRISEGQFGETWLCENPIIHRKAILKGIHKKQIHAAQSNNGASEGTGG